MEQDHRTLLALPPLDAAAAAPQSFWLALTARLDALGVDEDALRQFDFLGPDLGDVLRLPLQQWKARQQGTLAALCVAFLRLQEPLTWSELQQVFGGVLATALRDLGLALPAEPLPVGQQQFHFALRMGALNGMRILGDRALFHPDAVMGPSAATSRIFHAAATDTMPWGPDASLLDLGCGGGALALALWPHAAVRLGADISQRAIRMAAMNRMLNAGLSNEPSPVFAQGNLFAPVAGRRFRRIVCQPPFLPDTGSGSTFSAGGPWGDAITMDILRQLHNHLEPEGRAVLCVEWAASSDHHDGAPLWRSRVRQATAGQPLLGLHCELFRTSAEDYCTLLAPYLHPLGQPAYGNFLRRMLHHYQQQGIEWIDLVVHFFQPALDCPPVQAVRQVPLSALDHVTAQYADRGFQAMRLANAPDPALLAANLLAPAGFRVVALHPHPPPNVTVEFAPESLLAGGHLPLEAVAVLEAASGISGQEVLSMLPGSREENLNLIRQMLLQGLLFAE